VNLIELERALRQLRLGGIAAVLETRLHQAQAEAMAPIDLMSCLVTDELTRRSERLLERRRKQAAFRDSNKTLDNFDFTFSFTVQHAVALEDGGLTDGLATGETLRAIADKLNRSDFRTRRGSEWRHVYVAGVLKAAA
jgi:hypothetical protein